MKKTLFMLFACLLFIPCLVLADMSGPLVRPYNVTIINPNGAYIYSTLYDDDMNYNPVKTNNVIPYGTMLNIEDDGIDGADDRGNYVQVEYNGESGFILYSDVASVDKEYKITESMLGKPFEAIAIKDMPIKVAPQVASKNTGKVIKAGTKITVRAILEDGENSESEWDPFRYVEYEGVKGYINILGASLAMERIEEEFIVVRSVEITDPITGAKSSIPVNTILNEAYNVDPWSRSYYIKYKGSSGLVGEHDVLYKTDATIEVTVVDAVEVHEEAKLGSKVITTLEPGTKFVSYAWNDYQELCIYYEKDGVKGWIYTDFDDPNSKKVFDSVDWEEKGEYFIYDDEKDDKPVVLPSQEKKNNQILYLTIGAALLVALTAFVTITFVNKKNKNNEKV